MPIVVKKRAHVPKEFIEQGVKRIARDRLDYYREQIAYQGKAYAERYKSDIKYCLSLLDETLVGKGLDLEITNLRSLPYISYGVDSQDVYGEYIYGQTGNVICKNTLKDHPVQWDTGEWMIVIPIGAFRSNSLDNIHVIPGRDPKVLYRHPHHRTEPLSDLKYVDKDGRLIHPLLSAPHTCWGGFATPLISALRRGCISEVFQVMYQFVSSYTSNDVLVGLRWCTHFNRIEE